VKIRSNFIDTGNTSAQVAIGDHSHSTYALTSHTHSGYLSNTNISSPANGQVLGYEDGVWKNITVTVADTIVPTLLSTSPLDNATGVSISSNITMTFNEPIKAGTGNIVISNGTDIRTIDVADSSQVTISNATVTINPTTNLNGNSSYNIQMASGVIKDLNNNPYAGISDTTTFNFTTADVSNPVLSSTTPVNNATNIALTSNIVMTFSEPVKAGTGNILIKTGTTTVQTISVADTARVTFSGTTMTIDPATDLSDNTTYNIQMASGVVLDLNNNPYAGISDTTTFNFTTVDTTVDTTAPIVVSVTPSNGATEIPLDSNIIITFSKPVIANYGDIIVTTTTGTIIDTKYISVTDITQVTVSNNTMTINLTNNLNSSSTIYISLDYAAVQDLDGNIYDGTINGNSYISFTTAAAPMANIGEAGTQGFGVGVYVGTLPSGFTGMTGYNTPGDANYGNYQYTDANGDVSTVVFIPKFYYRIGSTRSPRYYDSDGVTVKYGLNAVDIVSSSTYANEAAANDTGYALHRAFIDGGVEKQGFFIDKYLASKSDDGISSCKSIFGGNPISLYSNDTSYNPSDGMVNGDCTGILADAVVLGRSRGVGRFNCASIFQYSALAMLSLAHGQASTSTTNCAWYDATGVTNFPKGCNNYALSDVNDTSVVYTVTDSDDDQKPKTGATSNFNKTTHNGQACGVADLNGCMHQVMLGITQPSSGLIHGTAWVLQRSKKLADLTSGLGTGTTGGLATDAWGSTSHLSNSYEPITGIFPWGSTVGSVYFGNGSNEVFSGAVSGTNVSYHRTSCGIQDTNNGISSTGTNLFGNDYCYHNNASNLFPTSSGGWITSSKPGVFYRDWGNSRSVNSGSRGFRCAAYGDET
jgi:methionine-rich copper-binding protein CopC